MHKTYKNSTNTANRIRTNAKNPWLKRHVNDIYVKRSKKDAYRSRAAYKLIEINDKFQIFTKNSIVLDLGSAPGSWSQVALKNKVGAVIAVDLLNMEPIPGITFITGDFLENSVIQKIKDALDGNLASAVLSDMAPNTTGIKEVDHLRIIALAEQVVEVAKITLKPGGHMVLKLFQGSKIQQLAQLIARNFKHVKYCKPKASRSESSEIYIVALNYGG